MSLRRWMPGLGLGALLSFVLVHVVHVVALAAAPAAIAAAPAAVAAAVSFVCNIH